MPSWSHKGKGVAGKELGEGVPNMVTGEIDTCHFKLGLTDCLEEEKGMYEIVMSCYLFLFLSSLISH